MPPLLTGHLDGALARQKELQRSGGMVVEKDTGPMPGAVNAGSRPDLATSMSGQAGSLIAALGQQQQIGTGDGPRSGAKLLASLRTRHAVNRSMSGMREDMRKMFGEDMDEEGARLQVLERASVEALEAAVEAKRCFVSPEHHFRQVWDLVQVFLLFYVAVTIPYREGYDQPVEKYSGTFWFEVVVDVYFICDIFFNFRTAIYDKEGVLELDTKAISKAYLRGWFALDVLACLPVTYIELAVNPDGESGGGGSKMKAFKIIRLLRLTKMLRVARIKRIFQRYEEQFAAGSLHKVMDAFRMLGYMLILGYITHVVGCLWYAVGFLEETDREGRLTVGWIERQGLIRVDRPVIGTDELGEEVLGEATWESRQELVPVSQHLLTSFYWSITTLTTVGYGDISARTTGEMIMSCMAEMLGGMIFGMLVGVVGTSITAGRMADQKYREQMEKIGEYMRIKQVPLNLRRRVRVFYENLYKQTSVFDEAEFLSKMSPQLKTETVQFIYRDIIGKVPILRGLPEPTVHKICLALNPYTAVRGDVIMRDGEDGDCFFIIVNGEVKMTVPDPETGEDVTVGVFGKGSFFGEEAVVSYYVKGQNPDTTIQRSETAIAVGDSQLAFMRREEAGCFMDDYEIFKFNMLQAYRKRTDRAEWLVQQHREHASGDAGGDGGSVTLANKLKKGQINRAKRRRASVVTMVSKMIGAFVCN